MNLLSIPRRLSARGGGVCAVVEAGRLVRRHTTS